MNPALLGALIGLAIFLLLAAHRSGQRVEAERRDAAIKAAQEAAEVESEEKMAHLPAMKATTTYKPKGNKMPKPIFLPTAAPTSLEEDPVVEWEPVTVVDEEGVIDWEKTEANAVFMNPNTGELIEYGHK